MDEYTAPRYRIVIAEPIKEAAFRELGEEMGAVPAIAKIGSGRPVEGALINNDGGDILFICVLHEAEFESTNLQLRRALER